VLVVLTVVHVLACPTNVSSVERPARLYSFGGLGRLIHGDRDGRLNLMQEPRVDEAKMREQLSTKRNLLFERFLENPSNVALVTQIRLIDTRIVELARNLVAEQKPPRE
jgi:hypothetical protein